MKACQKMHYLSKFVQTFLKCLLFCSFVDKAIYVFAALLLVHYFLSLLTTRFPLFFWFGSLISLAGFSASGLLGLRKCRSHWCFRQFGHVDSRLLLLRCRWMSHQMLFQANPAGRAADQHLLGARGSPSHAAACVQTASLPPPNCNEIGRSCIVNRLSLMNGNWTDLAHSTSRSLIVFGYSFFFY